MTKTNFFNIDISDIKNDAISEDNDFQKLYDSTFVDLSKKADPDRPLLSIGYKEFHNKLNPVYVWTEGEMSAIVGPSKTKKTFLLTALVSAYIGGGSIPMKFPNMITHRDQKATVIHFDTEQGKNYARKAFNRVSTLTDKNPGVTFVPFATRSLTAEQRVQLIDGILKRQKELYDYPIKVVAIDGIADLVDNTNDIVMSKMVSDHVMRWTNDYNLHVICVIHKNHGENSKPVGHLGSFVVKKAETIFLLNRENDKIEIDVSCDYARGIAFDSFSFDVDQSGLPFEVNPNTHSIEHQKSLFSGKMSEDAMNETTRMMQLVAGEDELPF